MAFVGFSHLVSECPHRAQIDQLLFYGFVADLSQILVFLWAADDSGSFLRQNAVARKIFICRRVIDSVIGYFKNGDSLIPLQELSCALIGWTDERCLVLFGDGFVLHVLGKRDDVFASRGGGGLHVGN